MAPAFDRSYPAGQSGLMKWPNREDLIFLGAALVWPSVISVFAYIENGGMSARLLTMQQLREWFLPASIMLGVVLLAWAARNVHRDGGDAPAAYSRRPAVLLAAVVAFTLAGVTDPLLSFPSEPPAPVHGVGDFLVNLLDPLILAIAFLAYASARWAQTLHGSNKRTNR